MANVQAGEISIEFDGTKHSTIISTGCKNLDDICKIFNDFFLIDGQQVITVKNKQPSGHFKGAISWTKNSNITNVILHLPPLLSLQCGLKTYEDVVNICGEQTNIAIENNIITVANMLTGLNLLNIILHGVFPVQNYCMAQIQISDSQLTSLLTDESKVLFKPLNSNFMVDQLSPKSVNFEISNDLNQIVHFGYCNISINIKRVSVRK